MRNCNEEAKCDWLIVPSGTVTLTKRTIDGKLVLTLHFRREDVMRTGLELGAQPSNAFHEIRFIQKTEDY